MGCWSISATVHPLFFNVFWYLALRASGLRRSGAGRRRARLRQRRGLNQWERSLSRSAWRRNLPAILLKVQGQRHYLWPRPLAGSVPRGNFGRLLIRRGGWQTPSSTETFDPGGPASGSISGLLTSTWRKSGQRSCIDRSVYSDWFHKLSFCLLFLINVPSTLTLVWTTDTQKTTDVCFFSAFLSHLVRRDAVACRVVAAADVTLCLRQQRQRQPPTM